MAARAGRGPAISAWNALADWCFPAGPTPPNPLFTPRGKLLDQRSRQILDLPPDLDPGSIRATDACMKGYRLRGGWCPSATKDRIVGLLQLNDRRKGCFLAGCHRADWKASAAHVGGR